MGSLRAAASTVADVSVVLGLLVVYVAALTVGTVLSAVRERVTPPTPSAEPARGPAGERS